MLPEPVELAELCGFLMPVVQMRPPIVRVNIKKGRLAAGSLEVAGSDDNRSGLWGT